jgi:hypothetical protein
MPHKFCIKTKKDCPNPPDKSTRIELEEYLASVKKLDEKQQKALMKLLDDQ